MEPNKPHDVRTLEVTVISGEDIRVDDERSMAAENAYVVVRAESLSCCTTKTVNEEGGLLAWNEKLLLDVPMHARSVTFEVHCDDNCRGDKSVGVARIALSDFVGGGLQMVSYGLRDFDGRRNGVIHLSVDTLSSCSESESAKGITMASSS